MQIFVFIFAVLQAREEVAFFYPFREFSWPGEYEKLKKLKIDSAHRWGAASVVVLFLFIGLSFQPQATWEYYYSAICVALAGFWYWLVFDPAFALGIKQKWYYLGDYSGTDNWIKKLLGSKAGQVKALICLGIIIVLNISAYFLKLNNQ